MKGAPSASLDVQSGPLGVLLRADLAAHCLLVRLLARAAPGGHQHEPHAAGAGAPAWRRRWTLAPQIGIPHQNLWSGDRDGHIGWTIFGAHPARTPAPARARSTGAWTGAADHPRILDPPLGAAVERRTRAWPPIRASSSCIGGHLASLGAEYDLGARAGQIRDDLLALERPTSRPRTCCASSWMTGRVFLARWQALAAVACWTSRASQGHPQRAPSSGAWWPAGTPRASVDSVGYRLVRAFHERTQQAVWDMMLAGAAASAPTRTTAPPSQFEGAAVAAGDRAAAAPAGEQLSRAGRSSCSRRWMPPSRSCAERCPQLERCTWGARNVVRIRHPLSGALPGLARFLDMPDAAAAGRSRHAARAGGGRSAPRSASPYPRATRTQAYLDAARRAERSSAVALLPRRFPRLGARRSAAVPARARPTHAHADTRLTHACRRRVSSPPPAAFG